MKTPNGYTKPKRDSDRDVRLNEFELEMLKGIKELTKRYDTCICKLWKLTDKDSRDIDLSKIWTPFFQIEMAQNRLRKNLENSDRTKKWEKDK